jgi:hypothetical protein
MGLSHSSHAVTFQGNIMSTNQISTIETSRSIVFDTKKGLQSLTVEGAVYKGGAALRALKDVALESALAKASTGRYGPAADILTVSFPAISKAYTKLYTVPASANKVSFKRLMDAVSNAAEPAKGWSKNQVAGRALLGALRELPALKDETAVTDATRTIEAA